MKKTITIIVIIGAIVTLATLGTWQVQRLTWKKEIIENLDTEYQKDPVENTYNIDQLKALANEKQPILFGSVKGRFLKNKEIFLKPKTLEGKVGAHIIQAYALNNKGTILVNRGWIIEEDIQDYRAQTSKNQRITGIFRKPEWNKFTSNNRADLNIWTKPDIKEIAEYLNINDVAPIMLYATQIENNGNLILQDAKWYPRNKHIQYAIFWYGMIFVLIILLLSVYRQRKIN